MGSGNKLHLSSFFGCPMTTMRTHSSTLIEEYHNILQKVLNAVMKWEHVISQCILCNRTAAIPGFKSIFILISGIRRERKPWSFFFSFDML